jgi:anti-sigma B factor antagonist
MVRSKEIGLMKPNIEESMNYSISEKYNTAIITLKGKAMGGPSATTYLDDIKSLIEQGKTNVIADLSKVNFMNSSGLGILITSLTSLRNAGGDLKICGASDRIESLLMVTKLITVFKHYKTLDEAVAAYQE